MPASAAAAAAAAVAAAAAAVAVARLSVMRRRIQTNCLALVLSQNVKIAKLSQSMNHILHE